MTNPDDSGYYPDNSTYSVLMSVYAGSDAEELREALESVFDQTMPTDDVVLVKDGPLDNSVESVIGEFIALHPDEMDIITLSHNSGLGIALNRGLASCKHDIVARMDTDDIAASDRCARQFAEFLTDPELDILSGKVVEFKNNPLAPSGSRTVPLAHKAIVKYSRKRNPFNHPAVMFRKSSVEAAGGYNEDYHFFEDYSLWVRMLKNGAKSANLKDTVLYMRTPDDIYLRRGGKEYADNMLRFHKHLLETGWSTTLDYWTGAIPHYIVCRLPNFIRKLIYKILH